MDREASRTAVCGVTKSRTRLSNWTKLSMGMPKRGRHQEPESDPLQKWLSMTAAECEHDPSQERPGKSVRIREGKCDLVQEHRERD